MIWNQKPGSWIQAIIFLLPIICFILGAQSEIVKESTLCGRARCKATGSKKFKYEENVSYWYRYSVDVSTNLGNSNASSLPTLSSDFPGNESTLRLDADLLIRFNGPCEGSLKFENSSLSHDRRKYNPEFPDRAGADFKVNLERFPLRFTFDDGQIDELCPDKREPIWALNLKRGVLSMLQNTMERFDMDHHANELDVNGVCETNYHFHGAKRTSLIVKKKKDLSNCEHGSKYFSVIRSNSYKSPRSRAPRHPLFASRADCELTIDRKIYEKIVCKEWHRLLPLSSNSTGARTESTATLRLIKESRDDHGFDDGYETSDEYGTEREEEDEEEEEGEREKISKYVRGSNRGKRSSLLYDYSKTPRTMHGELRSSRDLLKAMCRLGISMDELEQRFSEAFTAFIQSARFLDYPSLSQLFARADGICKTGKKHIVNALPFIGSNAALNVMRDLMIKRYVDQTTIDNWIIAFAFIPQPDRNTINILSPLLELRQFSETQFILSYSATIYAFCSNQGVQHCVNVEQVTRFLSHLEQKIEKGCAPRTHSFSTIKETLEALKAIGNMGLETERLLKLLKECTDDVGGFLPMEIRVASIDAHRRMPSCEKTRDLYFLNYYRNFTLDTELRIASYLQVMRCLDYNVVKTIKHTLKLEEINQVGTFVWSHLTNIYNSASPTKVEIQSLLTDRDLDDKFNNDRRKFSRNYDGSFFSEEYNFGANYQGNLIFSPKSYIPRSITFNLTFDLFGESVNVVEVTTRLEGLEYYAEKFFGPDGPYSNEKVSSFFLQLFRSFRTAPEQKEDYWQRVKRIPNVIDNNFNEPRISLTYKVFGNDLKYSTLNGDREIREALTHLNPWEKFKQIISGKEIHHEIMFLDFTYVVPMTTGLPVRLDLAGSAACNFKMSGLLDTRAISKAEIEFISNVAPSINVDMTGSMIVDAFYKTAGTKLRTNLYSSGAVQIHLEIKGVRSIKLSLGLPNKRTEMFSIATDILLTRGNGAEHEEKPLGVLIAGQHSNDRSLTRSVPKNVIANTSCTWAALDRLVGLKLCLDYQLSNVTKNPNASYFILNGPALFKIALIKADPTAKNYFFKYTWEKNKDENIFKIAYDTSGSQVNRELSAMISFDAKTHNVTVLLRSAGNSLVAEGTYKSTENETVVDIGFDINGTKHLDASLGYAIKRFHYGYTFAPQMHLIVNNELIAALQGTIRNASKNNVSQCNVDLTFQTKKVWSKLVGYIARRNISLTSFFNLEYQLQTMPKKETVRLELSSSNRSSKTLTHKTIDLKLHSTAYPQLNTVIMAWYQQALGHLELHAEVNSSPYLMDDRHKLTAQLIIFYSKTYFQSQDTKVSALIAITKPIQKLDVKVKVNHYSMGPDSKTSFLIGYAPGKEISLTMNLLMPRGLTFAVEGHANLTIPNFNSMLVDVRITERSKRMYELDLSGTWFSGHNVTARGTYSDRSVATVVSHSLKLVLKSPSFINDILVHCKLYRNYSDIRVDLRVEQVDRDKYAFILNHTVSSPTNLISYVEGRYKGSVYSVTTDVNTEREIRMEIHLDKWRDVHLALTGINERNEKGFGAEVKWDANRDPALKLALFSSLNWQTVQLPPANNLSNLEEQLIERNVSAIATLTYPGRFVVCSCQVTARDYYDYIVDASLDWNPEQTIKLFIATEYKVNEMTRFTSLETRLITPFENWKKTALSARYTKEQNRIKMSSSAYWKDSQRLIAELDGSAEKHDDVREWRINYGLNSSVQFIPSTIVNITHKIVNSEIADTRLLAKYHLDKVINAWSIWYLDKESENVFNLTGNLHFESPITRYKMTDMRCQLQVLPDWKFLGATNLNLDKKIYTGRLVGDLHLLKESMVEFNVTTPLEKFSLVRGRFGLSEKNKHVVAEIATPIGDIGFEALCQFFTPNHDFNVQLLLATPLEMVRRLLMIAKLNEREADFRVGYNRIVGGFQGIWHYRNITDFHYRYVLFTPLDGFEESGIVAKLIAINTQDNYFDIDTEFSLRLSDKKLGETKFGVRAKAGPKPAPVTIPIKSPIITENNRTKIGETQDYSQERGTNREITEGKKDTIEEEELEEIMEEEEEEANLHWHAEIDVCLAIVEPIEGELDIDKEGSTYKVAGSLRYFDKKILLDDTFWMEDLFNIKNELNVIVPFKFVNEIVCVNSFIVDLETIDYKMEVIVNVRQNTTWYETGLFVIYAYRENDSDDSQMHALQLNLKTPLESIKFVRTSTSLDIDENIYRAKVDIRAPNSTIDLFGTLESEETLMDTSLVIEIDTPLLKLPKSTVTVKREFTVKEKYAKVTCEVAEPISLFFQSSWYATEDHIKALVAFKSWIELLKNIEVQLSYSNTIVSNGTANLNILARHLLDHQYKLSGNYSKDGIVKVEVYTPVSSNKPHFEFYGETGKMVSNDSKVREFNGQLHNRVTTETRSVSGTFESTENGCLRALNITVWPKEGEIDNKNVIRVEMKREEHGLNVDLIGHAINGSIDAKLIDSLNWDVRIDANILKSSGEKNRIGLIAFTKIEKNGNTTLYVSAETPLAEIRNVNLEGSVLMSNNSGDVRVINWLNEQCRYATVQWKLLYMEDLLGRVLIGHQGLRNAEDKIVDSRLFFKNPRHAFRNVDVGFDLDVDREKWKFAANATIGFRNHENIDGVFTVRLPPPNNDDHRLLVSYHGNQGVKDASYVIGYNALRAKVNYASDGSIHMDTGDINGHIRASWGMLPVQSVNNVFNLSFDNKEIELRYSLYTPKFQQQETLVFLFDYNAMDQSSDKRAINAKLYYPASTRIASANVSYESLMNVNGTIDSILPLANVSQLGCQFIVFTTLQRNRRYAKVYWPQNIAILDSDYNYRSEKLNSDLEGILHAEIPLNTRHVGHLTYGYKKRPQTTTGYSKLTYNGNNVLHGRYNSTSVSRAGFEKDHTQIMIENSYKPIGIVYINKYEYSAGNEGTNYPTVEFKHVNLYRLDNETAFNVVGESWIKTTHTGQDIRLKAIHSNKTVQLKTEYQVLPGEFEQTSWFSLARDVWISYSINILNKTTEEVENQFLVLNVSYPRRNFSLDGFYWINSERLESELKLDWDRETERPKTVGALFNWRKLSSSDKNDVHQVASFALRHPSFSKQACLTGELARINSKDSINFTLTADYSTDPSKLFVLSATLKNESDLPILNRYSYRIRGDHPSTRFHLNVHGFVLKHNNTLFVIKNDGNYKRNFLTGDTGKLNARLDLTRDELFFQREHNEAAKYLNVRYYSFDGRYVVNGSVANTPNLNATGAFFLDPDEKLTWMMVNYTPDAVESLRMYGRIPDARNAVFNIWRTYEDDLTVPDVSFYLKLNHSRLVTSTLRWRPELKTDIVALVKGTAIDAYDGINNDIDYWKQYVKSETVNIVSDVWDDAQQDLQEFLQDWNNLNELRTDLEELKIYLNDSYNANDFYIKDIVHFGIYVIDELSLRSHIESLPSILNEIWEIMGESGQAIRNSLLWVIETIKNTFNKIPEFVTAVLRGDMISELATIIDKMLERYDKFVKDLHVSFIKYIGNLWEQMSQSISQQWNRFLLMVEPLFIRFIHYLETVVWKASKEVVDFLYDRRNDLIASPYFDRFTNLTQDIDKFYRDIKEKDIVTNVQKYSALTIRFLKDRYFTFVPFGKELKDVVEEIVSELKELQKLPSIRYSLEKMQQIYDRAYDVYEYFEIRVKIENAIRLIHMKLVDVSQTALQAENRYREAKTKFIFDPRQGLMCLEQKLPMSWHAFNQTPEFHEIPEIRAISDAKSYFTFSDVSFWSLYRYKPYVDPFNWLPPFRAQAMIIGLRHFITFDGRHTDFVGSCTYLLARDFVRNTFAILVEYQQRSDRITRKIIILLGRDALEIDFFNDSIKLASEKSAGEANDLVLPIQLENGTTYVYQAENVVTVERRQNQFRLECNLKFDLCTLELSGWYHGKTAGILGTMNYEPTDDMTASDGIVTKNVTAFGESWSIDREDCPAGRTKTGSTAKSEDIDSTILEFCDTLFVNKSSEFVSCFDVIKPKEYSNMCVTSKLISEACTVALSYMQICMFHDTYLRIPDVCSNCNMVDGNQVAEGQFVKLEGDRVPSSTDVVFIVEGKECNRNVKENRSIDQLIGQLSKEFRDQGLTDNRWSLVTFGADGVFDHPRSIVFDGQIFTKNVARFTDFFDHVPVGNGSRDIFAAIAFASKLVFRAGVSKTFILMPCSHCEPENQMLDYSVVHEVLLEHDITLHILMDGDFEFEKERLNKIFYGLDATKSYTKKDTRTLTGDTDLRRQVKLPKSALGYCTPLSLEINGTIFSGDKLRFDKLASIKKFASVFSKRVALTAQPNPCQNCECTADNNGVTRMECIPCIYPTPISVDYEMFNLNDSLASLQPLNIDYGQIDIDDT